MRWIALFVAVSGCTWPLARAMAQEQTAASQQTVQARLAPVHAAAAQPDEITLGQNLTDVLGVMRKQGKKQGGGFQLARNGEGAEEIKHISCVLDEQAIAGIFYKAGTEQVTSLGVAFSHRGRMTGRADQIWVSVRKITFHPDGSYALHFEKLTHAPPKPAAERPTNKIPTAGGFREEPFFGGNGQLPANPIRGDGRY